MVEKYLPLLRDLDRDIYLLPRTPRRLEATKAIGTLLDFLLVLQHSENLKGTQSMDLRCSAPVKTKGPRQN